MPLSPQHYGAQCTWDQETQDLYHRFRALMSHEIPSGDMASVLKRALQLAVCEAEKRKCAATSRPGHTRGTKSARHIPAAVKRAVWERDGRRCTYISEAGQRCSARGWLEIDHIEPVARGGTATVENLRLLCRAHNQHMAERTFGAEFMDRKRRQARERTG